MRVWIMKQLERSKKKIILYNQSISDPKILDYLIQRSKEGLIVEICQAYRDTEISSGSLYSGMNIKYHTSTKPYLHAKVFLIDDERTIL
jgi:phosphatidylserine/phosphatidylglycerophosphate/cardiolipin synthase-like enzyme